MTILVLGNGFDLAHGLPTSYANFLQFVEVLKEKRENDLAGLNNFKEAVRCSDDTLAKELKELLDEDNLLLKYFLSVYKERCETGKDGWIDFEAEISQIIQWFEKARNIEKESVDEGRDQFIISRPLHDKLSPFIYGRDCAGYSTSRRFNVGLFGELSVNLLHNLNSITRLLEIYLAEYVEKREVTLRIPEIAVLNNVDHIISFNYTAVYRKLYDKTGAEYCYIHGKARSDSNRNNCNLVLGIDEYLKDSNRRDEDNAYIWFKKFYQRIYKETDSNYIDWLDEFNRVNERMPKSVPQVLEIYFYGHSLDVTDKDVLEKLILQDNARIHIFYHSKDAMSKQIANLVKIIGEDRLIHMTRGAKRTIIFTPVGKMTN